MSTITPDAAPRFPHCPAYGFSSGPGYLVKIIAREGGFERRDLKWRRPLYKYDAVPIGDQREKDVEKITHFWHAMNGMYQAFRFTDPMDFSSALLDNETTAFDQPLIAVDSSPQQYQLVKEYIAEGTSIVQYRDVTRPIGNSISIANDSGAVQADWTLDEATGLVTPGGSFSGIPHSWGGDFQVWVRFNSQWAPVMSNWKIQSANIQMIEVRVASLTS